ncbi:hypothetical protein [Actinoallomurus sp. NPDC052274]|uniref:hypothetical protein n=1 Tax=Actinoallomurus sp. NPDC052274 TaxID=3155420 RepID=UPI003415DBEE
MTDRGNNVTIRSPPAVVRCRRSELIPSPEQPLRAVAHLRDHPGGTGRTSPRIDAIR